MPFDLAHDHGMDLDADAAAPYRRRAGLPMPRGFANHAAHRGAAA